MERDRPRSTPLGPRSTPSGPRTLTIKRSSRSSLTSSGALQIHEEKPEEPNDQIPGPSQAQQRQGSPSHSRPQSMTSTIPRPSPKPSLNCLKPGPLPCFIPSVDPLTSFMAFPYEGALLQLSSNELQDIVSRAIRCSARESFIRLLSLHDVDTGIPDALEKLNERRRTVGNKFRFGVQRKNMLMQGLWAVVTGDSKGGDLERTATSLLSQLCETNAECDGMVEELVRIGDEMKEIQSLLDAHWASALAVALRKLNNSYAKRTSQLLHAREKIEQLEQQLEEKARPPIPEKEPELVPEPKDNSPPAPITPVTTPPPTNAPLPTERPRTLSLNTFGQPSLGQSARNLPGPPSPIPASPVASATVEDFSDDEELEEVMIQTAQVIAIPRTSLEEDTSGTSETKPKLVTLPSSPVLTTRASRGSLVLLSPRSASASGAMMSQVFGQRVAQTAAQDQTQPTTSGTSSPSTPVFSSSSHPLPNVETPSTPSRDRPSSLGLPLPNPHSPNVPPSYAIATQSFAEMRASHPNSPSLSAASTPTRPTARTPSPLGSHSHSPVPATPTASKPPPQAPTPMSVSGHGFEDEEELVSSDEEDEEEAVVREIMREVSFISKPQQPTKVEKMGPFRLSMGVGGETLRERRKGTGPLRVGTHDLLPPPTPTTGLPPKSSSISLASIPLISPTTPTSRSRSLRRLSSTSSNNPPPCPPPAHPLPIPPRELMPPPSSPSYLFPQPPPSPNHLSASFNTAGGSTKRKKRYSATSMGAVQEENENPPRLVLRKFNPGLAMDDLILTPSASAHHHDEDEEPIDPMQKRKSVMTNASRVSRRRNSVDEHSLVANTRRIERGMGMGEEAPPPVPALPIPRLNADGELVGLGRGVEGAGAGDDGGSITYYSFPFGSAASSSSLKPGRSIPSLWLGTETTTTNGINAERGGGGRVRFADAPPRIGERGSAGLGVGGEESGIQKKWKSLLLRGSFNLNLNLRKRSSVYSGTEGVAPGGSGSRLSLFSTGSGEGGNGSRLSMFKKMSGGS